MSKQCVSVETQTQKWRVKKTLPSENIIKGAKDFRRQKGSANEVKLTLA